MSNKYKNSKDVPDQVIIDRLMELSHASTTRESLLKEFTLTIPVQLDRDPDVVLSIAADRLQELNQWKSKVMSRVIDIGKYLQARGYGDECNATEEILNLCMEQDVLIQRLSKSIEIQAKKIRELMRGSFENEKSDDCAKLK